MVGNRDVRVPVGPEAPRWVTVAAERTVLVAARTVTSAVRALEAVTLFQGDPRVQVLFAVDKSSAFSGGVPRVLREAGARIVPWDQVPRLRWDGVITASENTQLGGIDAPVLVLPHGIGFHKFVPDSRRPGRRVSGSVRPQDVAGRRVLLAVSHPEQAQQLRAHDPGLAAEPVVVADPVYQRLLASRWFRDRYRRALGAAGRRLVLVSSTWGRQSLLGRWPDAPARLLSGLPADEYRVVVALHPNIWSGHGAWQVRSWLAGARAAGLGVIPAAGGGWAGAVVAADCVVGDHGSVSLYAAGLDRALLLAPFGDEVVPGTSLARLGDLAPRLVPERPWAEQVVAAIAADPPVGYGEVAERTFAAAPVARPLRSVLYDLIALPEPVTVQPSPAWPLPEVEADPVAAYAVYTRWTAPDEIELRRIPAAVDTGQAPGTGQAAGTGDWLRHLAVDDRGWDLRLVHSASVLVREASTPAAEAWAWARSTLAELPGARMVAAGTAGGCVAALRDGPATEVSVVEGPACGVLAQAAGVYTLAAVSPAAGAGTVRLQIGAATTVLRVASLDREEFGRS